MWYCVVKHFSMCFVVTAFFFFFFLCCFFILSTVIGELKIIIFLLLILHLQRSMSSGFVLISQCVNNNPGTGYGYTTHRVNARLVRRFVVVNLPTPTDRSLGAIYGPTIQSVLDEFPSSRFDRPTELVQVLLEH